MASKAQEEELKATLGIERAERERTEAQLRAQIAELEKHKASLETQVKVATSGAGVPEELKKDIEWRIASGLSEAQAIDVARRQWNENLLAEQAKAKPESAETPNPAPKK